MTMATGIAVRLAFEIAGVKGLRLPWRTVALDEGRQSIQRRSIRPFFQRLCL